MGLSGLLQDAYAGWKKHEDSKLGASLAYYAILSLAPLVIIVIAIVGLVFGTESARAGLLTQVQGLVGSEGVQMIGTMITSAQKPTTGIISTVLGVVMLLFGASGVFGELHDSLNKIWEVKTKPGKGFWGIIRERFVSFGMVLGIGFLLLVSLLLSAGLAALGTYLGQVLPVPTLVLESANLLVSVLVITLLFAAIYRFLPSERLPWNDLWVGSLGTSIFFVVGKFLVGFYLGRASVGSAYGAAGSLVVLLVWIYYAAQLFFFGAEFTFAYARRHGSKRKNEREDSGVSYQTKVQPIGAELGLLPQQAVVITHLALREPRKPPADQNSKSKAFALVLVLTWLGLNWWRRK